VVRAPTCVERSILLPGVINLHQRAQAERTAHPHPSLHHIIRGTGIAIYLETGSTLEKEPARCQHPHQSPTTGAGTASRDEVLTVNIGVEHLTHIVAFSVSTRGSLPIAWQYRPS
jgi:hypothetical protein